MTITTATSRLSRVISSSITAVERGSSPCRQQKRRNAHAQPGYAQVTRMHDVDAMAAFLARRLTLISCDMPLEVEASALRRREPDSSALTSFFDHHGFGPLLRRQSERLAQIPFA